MSVWFSILGENPKWSDVTATAHEEIEQTEADRGVQASSHDHMAFRNRKYENP